MNKSVILMMLVAVLLGCEQVQQENSSAPDQSSQQQQLSPATQQDIDNIANHLNVSFELLSNHPQQKCQANMSDGLCYEAQLTLTAKQDIYARQWQIYYSQIAPLHNFDSTEFTLKHLNGDLHSLVPNDNFTGFKAGESKVITFRASYWSLAESDMMPNYIVTGNKLTARVIESTRAKIDADTEMEFVPYVKSYTDYQRQMKRTANDATPWLDSLGFYQRNLALGDELADVSKVIIPTPKSVTYPENKGKLSLASGLKIDFGNVAKAEVNVALERLAALGINTRPSGSLVKLNVEPDSKKVIGSYRLIISKRGIEITGVDSAGVFNGLQSLASLYQIGQDFVPYLSVDDQPLYEFRGMLVDVARNFRDKDFIIKLMDQMAAYKLNKLHLHMGEDEGWRLQIPGLPELTEVSSRRCLDFSEQHCLLPQLGAGISPDSSVNGYYTVEDYQEILRAATARHIQVIPSLDMPGHSRAAIKAMAARYQKYSQLEDNDKAEQYLLHDLNDITQYSSVQFYHDNTINACQESSYAFIKKVMSEVQKIHADAGQPLTRYHIGADETAGAWLASPVCQNFIANNDQGVTEMSQLGAYFVERVANMLADMGIEPAAWSDGLEHTHKENMPAVVQANAWDHLPWGAHQRVNELANRNWQVVLSIPDVTYFDFPYEADPKEHGYYWASRRTNTEKVFQFMPENLPAHAEFWLDRQDNPYVADDTIQRDEQGKVIHQPLQQGRTFLGVQGQLWSENVRTDNVAEYKIFPRIIALAERAWHKAKWAVPYNYAGYKYSQNTNIFTEQMQAERDQAWRIFANTIGQKELTKLDLAEVKYRLPTVGAKIAEGKLYANITFPGLTIQYQQNNGSWQQYRGPVAVTGEVQVRAVTSDGSRAGRKMSVVIE
ncbi:beta-N-acetylhexosaminidase [Thalassotalea insulae]|uniref:beta-N-acetylhexosaminidase n=1 Tax=Thalassotalea insulae TaxID=2056778 RepID=A0ABQ6GWQ1_9GAMM|nr:family 20 glycosylhydrolase [Thalassotalea insulae]GLX79160.1 beta-N-acetylhexosaminidase [Thalassotalea insulae]